MTLTFRRACDRLLSRGLPPPRFHPAELFLLAVLVVFGTIFALAIPLGAGWDEETHLIRVWDLAHLHFIPNEVSRHELPYPAIFWNLSYRRQLLVRPVESGFWERYKSAPIDEQGYLYGEPSTYSRPLHSAPLYLPYAFALRYLGLKFQLPALTAFFGSRLAGLATFAMLAWLAVRIAPFGKWMLAVVALAPTTIFQAATIGADPVSNGLALVFIAGCLAVSVRKQIGWIDLGSVLALSFVLFWAKVNLAILALLPLLILPRSRFRMRGGYLLLAASILILAVVEVGGWNVLVLSQSSSAEGTVSLLAKAEYLTKHPIVALGVILSDIGEHGCRYLREWVAEYGYGYGSVPLPTYFLFGAAVFSAWRADSMSKSPSTRTRRGLLLTYLACMLGTSLLIYLTLTPLGATSLVGIHGRYYAAMVPLLGLAVIGVPKRRPAPAAVHLAIGLSAASLTFYGLGLVLSYHVPCGASYYQPGLCYQPAYKNWAPNDRFSSPVSITTGLSQELVPECDGMAEIRVWVDAAGLAANGQTSFVARDPAADRDLARTIIANAELPHGGWVSLKFDPQWDSLGRLYLLRITQPQDSSVDGARIALTARQEYPEVKLTENSMPVDADLVFRYGCVAGLGKYVPAFRTQLLGGD